MSETELCQRTGIDPWFMAELAPLSEPGLVPQEVAGALDVQ